ncbi:mechanosensitive ion channel [Candidatus Uhrbacteria bacterium]|nr:mechanosensitive ion channel [Candidatus Uhrbacteria bacterium]
MTLELLTRVLLILLGAVVLNGLVRSGIRRIMRGGKGAELRIRGVAFFLDRASSVFFAVIAIMMVLDSFRIDTRPLLTGVGVAGLFATFASQAILKDVFSGIFVFFEDLYEEGDRIALDDTKGVVQRLTLRKTVLKDRTGRLHHIPHGGVKIVTVEAKRRTV